MTTESKRVNPFDPEPTSKLTLEWADMQFYRLANILASLTDGTGTNLKYIKIVGSVDGTSFTLSDYHHVVLVDADSADVTINLPVGIDQKRFHVKNISTAGNNVIIDPNGSETIDGNATRTLTAYQAVSPMFLAEDDEWYIL